MVEQIEKHVELQGEFLVDLIKPQLTTGKFNAIKLFLETEIKYRCLPYPHIGEITCEVFVKNYGYEHLIKNYGIGPRTYTKLHGVLKKAGYNLF